MLRTTFASPFAHSPARSARQILSLPCSSLLVSVVDVVDLHLFRARLPTRIPRRRAKAFAPSSRRAWSPGRPRARWFSSPRSNFFSSPRTRARTSRCTATGWLLRLNSPLTRNGTSTPPPVGRWITLPSSPGSRAAWRSSPPWRTPACSPSRLSRTTPPRRRCSCVASHRLRRSPGARRAVDHLPDRRPTFARPRSSASPRALLLLLVVFSPGLLMIDHVHFQYNSAASGALLCARRLSRRPRDGRVLFSVLVHFKHVHVYAAPAIAAHLLAHRVGARWSDATFSSRATRRRAGRACEVPRRRRPRHRRLPRSLRPRGRPRPWSSRGSFPSAADSRTRTGPRTSGRCTTRRISSSRRQRDAPPARRRSPRPSNLAGGMSGHGGTGARTHAALPTVTPALTFALTLASCLPFIARHVAATSSEAGDRRVSSLVGANDDVRVRVRMARPREGTSDGDDAVGGGARAGRR